VSEQPRLSGSLEVRAKRIIELVAQRAGGQPPHRGAEVARRCRVLRRHRLLPQQLGQADQLGDRIAPHQPPRFELP
jgi:hypothetical protein